MSKLTNLLSSLIIAAWAVAIAVLSVQNYSFISLKFLTFTSIPFPFGVLLTFCFGGGLILGALFPLLLGKPRRSARSMRGRERNDYLEESDPLEDWS
ncbi:lipopolysaccharide assembly protein LapA domain-containing protein [Oscillatoria sp. FACHB-1406]|uniref:lipopolysaccharide assembly protein LapA domain-containing protein n=1 Tax=Oscillatoria sp. FACHB-1406 TaxID=2692846 RepID=UPI00168658C7|nr:lipopolysaccharide assembly protein LapA domain-containing protein [Oscillatoria sp. FACHB-1406]MBD2577719.1 DUF1049 domain-containing protein [Oscillatoria sp. FACHB-1406]